MVTTIYQTRYKFWKNVFRFCENTIINQCYCLITMCLLGTKKQHSEFEDSRLKSSIPLCRFIRFDFQSLCSGERLSREGHTFMLLFIFLRSLQVHNISKWLLKSSCSAFYFSLLCIWTNTLCDLDASICNSDFWINVNFTNFAGRNESYEILSQAYLLCNSQYENIENN